MRRVASYVLRVLPPIVLYGGWKCAQWALDHYCQGNLKDLGPCYVGHTDIRPFVGIGVFWFQLLWFPALLVSVVLVGRLIGREAQERGVAIPRFTWCDACAFAPKAIFVWVALSLVGLSFVLVVFYPYHPTTFMEWLLLTGIWVPVWAAASWLSER
jgi:hypothetical protein